MRRKDKAIRNIAEIENLIDKALVCRVAMVDGEGPYVVPMCFVRQENRLFLHSALNGKKIDALKKNPSICFEIDHLNRTIESDSPCDWSMSYQSVIGFGRATFIDDLEEKRAALERIFQRYAGSRAELPDGKVQATAVIRIDIDRLTGKASGV